MQLWHRSLRRSRRRVTKKREALSRVIVASFGKLAFRVHYLMMMRCDERDSVRIKKRIAQLVAKQTMLFVDFVLLMYYSHLQATKHHKAIREALERIACTRTWLCNSKLSPFSVVGRLGSPEARVTTHRNSWRKRLFLLWHTYTVRRSVMILLKTKTQHERASRTETIARKGLNAKNKLVTRKKL